MNQALSQLDATEQAALVASGEATAFELVDAAIARIETWQPKLNCLVSYDFEAARARAKNAPAGPLAGVPFLIKDVLAYPGQRFSGGSRLFRQYVAPSGSPYTEQLDRAGLITLGKTTTSELGLLGSTESLLTGITHNPWSAAHSAMGSSGGAAAAVAAGLVPMAHASDAGGSIRLPASVCGLFGFKPSRGRLLSTSVPDPFGLLSDHVITRSVRDSALMLALTESADSKLPAVGHVRTPERQRLRIVVYTRTALGREADREVIDALKHTISLCRSLGHEVVECEGPRLDGATLSNAFFATAGAGIAQVADMVRPMLGRDPGADELEPFTLALWDWYRALGPAALSHASAAVQAGAMALDGFLSECDVALCPTLPTLPPLLGTLAPTLSREEIVHRTEVLAGFTAVYNMAGAAAMNVPLFVSPSGLPIGSHFAARAGADAKLLSLAYELEEADPWCNKRPPLHA